MTRWAPSWDDDLGPAPDVDPDPTPTPDGEGEDVPSGAWSQQYRANRTHDCIGTDPYCPGEIREGELYLRLARLDRPPKGTTGPTRRGTVAVTRACLACMEYPR